MNTEKTKVIWIGSRKHTKEKMNIPVKLIWGDSYFTLLGLEFSTNLDEIPDINYNKALGQVKK